MQPSGTTELNAIERMCQQLYFVNDVLVRVGHARNTYVEAARWWGGAATENNGEDCSPASAEVPLLPCELAMCRGCHRKQLYQRHLSGWMGTLRVA